MHPLPSCINTYSDRYLQIPRGKQTIFTDVSETTAWTDFNEILTGILRINCDTIRLSSKEQLLDIDGKHLLEYGIIARKAQLQTLFQLINGKILGDFIWDSHTFEYQRL